MAINAISGHNTSEQVSDDKEPSVTLETYYEPDDSKQIYIPSAPPKFGESGGLRLSIRLFKDWKLDLQYGMHKYPDINDPDSPY